MNRIVAFGLVAAAAVVALVAGLQLMSAPGAGIGGPGEEATPTPASSLEPTPDPTTTPSVQEGLPEGPWLLSTGLGDDGETLHPPLTVTIPAPGWDNGDGNTEPTGILLQEYGEPDGAGMIVFSRAEYYVYADPCNWQAAIPDQPVTTVDEFVAALAAQPSRNASEPVDITVGGYSGKSITLEIPEDLVISQCDEETFASYSCGNDAAEAIEAPCRFHQGPGETSVEYILDMDGMIVAWHTGYGAEAPEELVAELEAIVRSATFRE